MRKRKHFFIQLIIISAFLTGCGNETEVVPTPIANYVPSVIFGKKPTATPVATQPLTEPTKVIESAEILPTPTPTEAIQPTVTETVQPTATEAIQPTAIPVPDIVLPQTAVYPVENIPDDYIKVADISDTFIYAFSREYSDCVINTYDDTIVMTYKSDKKPEAFITVTYSPENTPDLPPLGTYSDTKTSDRHTLEKTVPIEIPGYLLNSENENATLNYVLRVLYTNINDDNTYIDSNTILIMYKTGD